MKHHTIVTCFLKVRELSNKYMHNGHQQRFKNHDVPWEYMFFNIFISYKIIIVELWK